MTHDQAEALSDDPVYPGNTDDASAKDVLAAILYCARLWVPEARIIGNIRAGDIVRALASPAPAGGEGTGDTSPREQAIEEIAGPGSTNLIRVIIDRYEAARARLDGAKMMPREAFACAVGLIMEQEPPDSRAVSDIAVALASVECGTDNAECWKIIRRENARMGAQNG